MTIRASFVPASNIALFLDVDGTLLEIAPAPNAVKVPAALRNTLNLAARREGGALALISGRSIAELDRLFSPFVFAAAGLHGAERRDARRQVTKQSIDRSLLDPARSRLTELASRHRGLLLEDKGIALAIHYRQAHEHESVVRKAMTELASTLSDTYELRRGKCVYELLPKNVSKRSAIEAFMNEPPFIGRIPVFVGDDVTDEDGFEAVNRMNGYSIRVGHPAETAAHYNFGSEAAVVAWLRERNTNP